MVEASRFAVIIILPHRPPLGCDRRHIFAHFRAAADLAALRAALWKPGSEGRPMVSDVERRFLAQQRIAHLATADRRAAPHVVPVCFAVLERTLYITIDEKPKRRPAAALKRLRNIAENPAVAVIVDRYDEDWTRLGWVMLRGQAEILREGREHRDAQALLRSRYPQLGAMEIAKYPVIAVRIERTTSWGNLSARAAS
jgi:PPOX class probable F420-dependent enzyme